MRATGPLVVVQSRQPELFVAAPPPGHVVVVKIDELADLSVGHPVGGQQDDPCPFGDAGLHGASPSPGLQYNSIAASQLEGK